MQQNYTQVLAPILASAPDSFHIPYEHGRQQSISEIVHAVIEKKNITEEPFFLFDLEHLARKWAEWRELMPRVEPHYAVKCNPHPQISNNFFNSGEQT